jgi:SAM-dependent methyltransferase
MRGYLDQITVSKASGWVFDPDHRTGEVQVRLTLDGKVVGEAVANLPRPGVGKLLGTDGRHGFRLLALALAPEDLGRVVVEARSAAGEPWRPIQRRSGTGRKRTVQYQTFDDAKGASNSADKLKALRLGKLRNRHSEATPLKGLSVLDLGCNEGYFCGEALRQGARRVVGIDRSREAVERARKRFPDATFLRGSWWDLPNEQFDVILFLSAIHYEPRQRALLQKLAGHLTPTGTLILECGIVSPGTKTWHAVKRADGVRRYPSYLMLRQELLKPYVMRHGGESVPQAGDPVPRFVYHCSLKQPVALLMVGASNVGKTSLAFDLGDRNISLQHTDRLLGSVLGDKRYDWSPVAAAARKVPPRKPVDLAAVGRAVAAECPKDFVDLLMLESPTEADLFCIEGEILRHDVILKELIRRLREQGIRPWLLTPEVAASA